MTNEERALILYEAYETAPKPGCRIVVEVIHNEDAGEFAASIMRETAPGHEVYDRMCSTVTDTRELAVVRLGDVLAARVKSNIGALAGAMVSHAEWVTALAAQQRELQTLRGQAIRRQLMLVSTFYRTEGVMPGDVAYVIRFENEDCDCD